jgi:hypothetical protein
VFQALALLKEARREGTVQRRGAFLVATIRRLCEERGLADPLPSASTAHRWEGGP